MPARACSTQTRRHSYLVSLLGIRHVVLAVNKMDLVGYSRDRFDAIAADYRRFAARVGLTDITAIPTCAVDGDNIVEHRATMSWYEGPCSVPHLETVEVSHPAETRPFRLPVQLVTRPHSEFRGVCRPRRERHRSPR